MLDVRSFAAGQWITPGACARNIASAITGGVIAQAGNDTLDVQAMLGFARDVGGPNLRKLTLHDRARMLKAVALYLMERKETLYDLSYDTGATLIKPTSAAAYQPLSQRRVAGYSGDHDKLSLPERSARRP